jgi:hypothetical protein
MACAASAGTAYYYREAQNARVFTDNIVAANHTTSTVFTCSELCWFVYFGNVFKNDDAN